MNLIIIAATAWLAYELLRRIAEKRRQREAERRYTEQRKIAQMVREDRQRRAEETAARIALEAEQMRQKREQERLAREQERQAKAQAAAWDKQRREDERRDAQLAKHEKRLADLEYTVAKATRDIDDLDEKLADLYGQLDSLILLQAGAVAGSKQYDSYQNKIVTKRDQIRRAESKRYALKHTKEMAQRELAA